MIGSCGTEHDPEPWLTYTMQTGSAGGWQGQPKFKPRAHYCRDLDCYTKTKASPVITGETNNDSQEEPRSNQD